MINRILGYQKQGDYPPIEKNSTDESKDAAIWTRAGQRVLGKLEKTITEHPVAALGVAIAAGISLGWLVKRR